MNTLLDIFGSVIIAALLFMLISRLNLFSQQTSYTSDNELKLIQNTKTLAEIIDYDFRKIGYRSTMKPKIKFATNTEIQFYADIDSINNVNDLIRYWTVPSSEKGYIILQRTINDASLMSGPSLGLDSIKFTYLNGSQQLITNPSGTYLDSIKYIKTEMWVKSTEGITDAFTDSVNYSATYWEFTINPRNI